MNSEDMDIFVNALESKDNHSLWIDHLEKIKNRTEEARKEEQA